VQSAFKDITKLRLPFPLHFQLRSAAQGGTSKPAGTKAAAPPKVRQGSGELSTFFCKTQQTVVASPATYLVQAAPEQYAGAYEFTAPEGVAVVPSWMLTVGCVVVDCPTRESPKASALGCCTPLPTLNDTHCPLLGRRT
jgi:hypothetical protein